LHVDLDESASQLLGLPGRGRLAGAQPDDHILPSCRLAGMQRNILDDAVALVEDSDDRHALRHRRDAALAIRRRGGLPGGRQWGIGFRLALTASGERKRDQQWCPKRPHAYSGIQGS